MTLKNAIHVLMENAAAGVAGAGCGVRAGISATKREQVVLAIQRVFPIVYGRHPDAKDFHNMQLPAPGECYE